ncbi:hypothetical protein FRC07_002165, partial [Ceratobasidium sp. 392]
ASIIFLISASITWSTRSAAAFALASNSLFECTLRSLDQYLILAPISPFATSSHRSYRESSNCELKYVTTRADVIPTPMRRNASGMRGGCGCDKGGYKIWFDEVESRVHFADHVGQDVPHSCIGISFRFSSNIVKVTDA